jgi:hypothetical protein
VGEHSFSRASASVTLILNLGHHIHVPGRNSELCRYPRLPLLSRARRGGFLPGRSLPPEFLVRVSQAALTDRLFLRIRHVLRDHQRPARVCYLLHERRGRSSRLAMGVHPRRLAGHLVFGRHVFLPAQLPRDGDVHQRCGEGCYSLGPARAGSQHEGKNLQCVPSERALPRSHSSSISPDLDHAWDWRLGHLVRATDCDLRSGDFGLGNFTTDDDGTPTPFTPLETVTDSF